MTSFADLGGTLVKEEENAGFADLGGTPVAQPVDNDAPYQAWLKANNARDDDPTYDYRAAFNAGKNRDPDSRHFTDEYKTPLHPTFSVDSKVSGGKVGGVWTKDGESWLFNASAANMEHQTREQQRNRRHLLAP